MRPSLRSSYDGEPELVVGDQLTAHSFARAKSFFGQDTLRNGRIDWERSAANYQKIIKQTGEVIRKRNRAELTRRIISEDLNSISRRLRIEITEISQAVTHLTAGPSYSQLFVWVRSNGRTAAYQFGPEGAVMLDSVLNTHQTPGLLSAFIQYRRPMLALREAIEEMANDFQTPEPPTIFGDPLDALSTQKLLTHWLKPEMLELQAAEDEIARLTIEHKALATAVSREHKQLLATRAFLDGADASREVLDERTKQEFDQLCKDPRIESIVVKNKATLEVLTTPLKIKWNDVVYEFGPFLLSLNPYRPMRATTRGISVGSYSHPHVGRTICYGPAAHDLTWLLASGDLKAIIELHLNLMSSYSPWDAYIPIEQFKPASSVPGI